MKLLIYQDYILSTCVIYRAFVPWSYKLKKFLSLFTILIVLFPYIHFTTAFATDISGSQVQQSRSSDESASVNSGSAISDGTSTTASASKKELTKPSSKTQFSGDEVDVTVEGTSEVINSSLTVKRILPKTKEEITKYTNTINAVQNSSNKLVNAAQIYQLEKSKVTNSQLSTTFTFKSPLNLRGIKNDKSNVAVAAIDRNQNVKDLNADITLDESGSIASIKLARLPDVYRFVIYTTSEKTDSTVLSFEGYGRITFSAGTTIQEATKYTLEDFSKRVQVKILVSDKEKTELSDYKEVAFKQVTTWNNTVTIEDVDLDKYDLVKVRYQEAHTNQETDSYKLANDYPVSSYLGGNYQDDKASFKKSENIIKVYLKKTKSVSDGASIAKPRTRRATQNRAADDGNNAASLPHNKRIDYLGDKKNNPDTTVDDGQRDTSDLYRLYMDITGKQQPIDVLVVADQSASMQFGIGGGQPSRHNIRRDTAINNALNGQNGLLKKFLDMNPENKLAVISFQGNVQKQYWNGNYWDADHPSIAESKDASILANWGRPNSVSVQAKNRNGTNYAAGLHLANKMLNDPSIANNGHRKIMIFISDGVPTFYFHNGYRYGTGIGTDVNNVRNSKEYSKQAFDEFKNKNPNVTTYTLGVSKDITSETETSSPEVLKYMAEHGNGLFAGVTDTASLERSLNAIVDATKVTEMNVTDELSQYVNYYSEQPDVKITRKHVGTGQVETLYEKNQVTTKGRGIIDSVGFQQLSSKDSTGKINLKFKSNFRMDDQYIYTLSYNVKSSEEAYRTYAHDKGKYKAKGDDDTDYKGNVTSSSKEGFYTNKDAYATYKVDNVIRTIHYKHPVAQVEPTETSLTKVAFENQNTKLSAVRFELREEDKRSVWTSGETNSNGQLTLSHLKKGKTYYLFETKAASGYTLPEKPWKITVTENGEVSIIDQLNHKLSKQSNRFVITNHKIYQLPSSGGTGPYLYTIIGVMVVATSTLVYVQRKRREVMDDA